MPRAAIRWERCAYKELMALPRDVRKRIVLAVDRLAGSPLAGEVMSGQWLGLMRLRVGIYRVIYSFDGDAITVSVLRVGNRREVYRPKI